MAIAWTEQHKGFYDSQSNWEGVTLKVVHDQSYRIMSDVWGSADWAIVWDEATASPKHVLVNVYDMNGPDWKPVQITVDATDEVRAKYLNWRANIEYETLLDAEEQRVHQIEKGAIAKVVKGKSGKGTIGKVVVAMTAPYRTGWRANPELKVAIATSDVKVKKALRNGKVAEVYQDVVWAWARNVVREDIARIDLDTLRKQAQERAVRYCTAA
jgi:hypothetical protein